MALVIIKFFLGVWSTIAVWRCAYILREKAGFDPKSPRISFMKDHKLPPSAMWPCQWPTRLPSWIVAISLIVMAIQSYISPLLSGSVNWDPSSVPTGDLIHVNDTNPGADIGWWKWYLTSTKSRRQYLQIAAGKANLGWANSGDISANGTSVTGNGCRHVINSDGLAVNSTVSHFMIPCIKINGISWATSSDDVPASVSSLIEDSSNLSLVDQGPLDYYDTGVAVLFDPDILWNASKSTQQPPATIFSGTKSLALFLARPDSGSQCTSARLGDTPFGSSYNITQYMVSYWNACYLVGTVNLTAGITNSSVAKYISSTVIEDQTPLSSVVFETSPWVQESLWLLPDLMATVALMNANSTLMPTYDNIDGYVELLIRQSYLAAWDTFHSWFDGNGPLFEAMPQESRIKASISFSRVFSWLAICLLTTLGGLMLLVVATGYKEEDEERRTIQNEIKSRFKDGAKGITDEAKPAVMDASKGVIQNIQS